MVMSENCILEDITSRLKLGNACYHAVKNLLSSLLLSKILKKYTNYLLGLCYVQGNPD
jgi:hypothetical protein